MSPFQWQPCSWADARPEEEDEVIAASWPELVTDAHQVESGRPTRL